jgi:hypothetical protein
VHGSSLRHAAARLARTGRQLRRGRLPVLCTRPKRGLTWSDPKYAHYGLRNEPSAYAEVLALYPRRVLAWTAFPKDATRFTFG